MNLPVEAWPWLGIGLLEILMFIVGTWPHKPGGRQA
jgi:hypothetical protein